MNYKLVIVSQQSIIFHDMNCFQQDLHNTQASGNFAVNRSTEKYTERLEYWLYVEF